MPIILTDKNMEFAIIVVAVVPQPEKTAMRVAAGAIAKKYLHERYGIDIRGYLAQLGPIRAEQVIWETIEENPFFLPRPQ